MHDESAQAFQQRERRAARRRGGLREPFAVVARAVADGGAGRGGVLGAPHERGQADRGGDRGERAEPFEQQLAGQSGILRAEALDRALRGIDALFGSTPSALVADAGMAALQLVVFALAVTPWIALAEKRVGGVTMLREMIRKGLRR
jgi:hypothetical protein